MAFSGLHVSFHFGGVYEQPANQLPVVQTAEISENVPENTLSNISAPQYGEGKRQPLARVDVAVDSYVAIGKNPDPSQSPRNLVRATGQPYEFACQPGDKVKWVAIA